MFEKGKPVAVRAGTLEAKETNITSERRGKKKTTGGVFGFMGTQQDIKKSKKPLNSKPANEELLQIQCMGGTNGSVHSSWRI